MEKTLDELIDHLLGEIALCGPSGASVSDLKGFVDSFYYNARNQDPPAHRKPHAQATDDAFICAVWRWLTRQSDIRIGKDNEHSGTLLQTLRDPGSSLTDQAATLPRIFVGNDRIYQAICGHEYDEKRVFKSEYGLLVHIAAARSRGILQGDLGRVAGQDKRSVPKRTDSLHAKGYIIKENVSVRGGHRSSHLTLRRFATARQIANAANSVSDQPKNGLERTVRDVVNSVNAIFKAKALVEIEALASAVGMSKEPDQKALVKILRPLVRAGFLKKVRAAAGSFAHTGEPKPCFQRLRDFEHSDLDGFVETSSPLEKAISDVLIDQEAQSSHAVTEQSDQPTSQWNPDRNIANVVQDAVSLAGPDGLTNHDARILVTGLNIKRPLESQLVRQSFAGLISQPSHLRHLSVVRVNKGAAASPEYIHHSMASIEQMVSKGDVALLSVPGIHDVTRDRLTENGEPSIHSLDKFGFPTIPDGLLLQDGAANLTDCANSSTAEDLGLENSSSDEATPRRGRRKLAIAPKPLPTLSQSSPALDRPGDSEAGHTKRKYTKQPTLRNQESTVIGRPRKFAKGTEKFWQHHFWHARLDVEGFNTKRAGTMSHPIGQALFDSRPQRFDEVLVKAKEAGLPLPQSRHDISEEWLQKTLNILEREEPGVYITPCGMHTSRVLHKSQILIVRSNRLHTLDLQEHRKIYGYRFLTSSAAHSFQYWRWFPSAYIPPKRSKKHTSQKFDVEYPPDLLEAFGQLPRAGIFYEPRSLDTPTTSQATSHPKMTAEEYKLLMDETDLDSDIERRMTPTQQVGDNSITPKPLSRSEVAQGEAAGSTFEPLNANAIVAPRRETQLTLSSIHSQRSTVSSDFADSSVISEALDTSTSQVPILSAPAQNAGVAKADDPGPKGPSHRSRMSNQAESETLEKDRRSSASPSTPSGRRKRLTQKAADWMNRYHSASASIQSASNIDLQFNDEKGGGTENDEATASNNPHVALSDDTGTVHDLSHTEQNQFPHYLQGFDRTQRLPQLEPFVSLGIDRPNQSPRNVNARIDGDEIVRSTITALLGKDEGAPASDNRQATDEIGPQVPSAWKPSHHRTSGTDVSIAGVTLKRKRSISEGLDVEEDEEDRPSKARKRPERTQAAACKAIILELLRLNDDVGPGNHSVIRRAAATLWRAHGFPDLPNLTTVKRALENLLASGQLKQQTFSFREQGGLTISRSILYPPTTQLTESRIGKLKEAIISAGLKDYLPPTWTDLSKTATRSRQSRPSSQDEIRADYMPGRAPLETTSFRQRRPRIPTTTNDVDALEKDLFAPPSRLRGRPRKNSSASLVISAEDNSSAGSRISSRGSSSASTRSPEGPHSSFLTLRVPRLGTIPQVQLYNQNFERPAHLRTAPSPGGDRPKRQTKSRSQKPKEDSLRKVLSKRPALAGSLDEILDQQLKSELQEYQAPNTSDAERFFTEVTLVGKWEERLLDDLIETKVPWTFINHMPKGMASSTALASSWKILQPTTEGQLLESPLLEFESWLPFSQTRKNLGLLAGVDSVRSTPSSQARMTRQATGSLRSKRRFSFDDVDLDVPGKRFRTDSDEAFGREDNSRREKRAYVRKPKKANPVDSQYAALLSNTSNDDIVRIGMSIMVVSTLVGGPERSINWSIVRGLHPHMQLKGLRSRWKAIEHLYADELAALASTLRGEYLEAVQDRTVPMVDLSDHIESDWNDIVDWSLATLPSFIKENVLPASHGDLEHQYNLSFEASQNVRPMLVPHANLRIHEREQLVSRVPFSQALCARPDSKQVDQARAIILSTALSPTFDNGIRAKATSLLSSNSADLNVAENATATALTSLLSDRVISKADSNLKRLPALVENDVLAYTLTSKIRDVLETNRPTLIINHDLLCEATAYKLEILDEAFAAGNTVSIPNQSKLSNGQSLALFNLLHQGMITPHPGVGSKKSRYGVSWEKVGYMTRQVEQAQLGFEVVIQASEGYRFGHLLPSNASQLPAPRKGNMGEWPMWTTLPDGAIDQQLWQKVLAATIGIVELRPGVAVQEIREMVGGVVTDWEVETVLGWAERSGFVRQSVHGKGWQTREWWWWCCCVASQ